MILDLTLKSFFELREKKGLKFVYDQILYNYEKVRQTNCIITSNFEALNFNNSDLSGKKEFFGVPVVIKDNIVTKDILTTAASKILEGFIPPYDATAVKRLKEAGCFIVGKSNLDEFGMGSKNKNSVYGACLNPWDITRVPGGSSGGSAVAVASRICVAALGSDTGGSVRLPAAFCGVYGLKPTYGKVSRYGLIAFGSSLDCIGVMASDVNTVREILNLISGIDENDETSVDSSAFPEPVIKKRFGYLNLNEFRNHIDPEILLTYSKTINFFKEEGYECLELNLEFLKYIIPCYYIICTAEAASNLSRFDGLRYGFSLDATETELDSYYLKIRTLGFGEEVRRRILLGNFVLSAGYQGRYYSKALKLRGRVFRMMEEVFQNIDVLLTPTSPVLPPRIDESQTVVQEYLMDIFTVLANLCGYPALSFPAGFSSNNLPIGVQIIGNLFSEDKLFHYAELFERNHEFNKAVPAILIC